MVALSRRSTIWKFVLKPADEVVVNMPSGATVLCIQVQGIDPCIWAVVDPDADVVPRKFYIRGTGHPMGEAKAENYIGTFQIANGRFVFHVFED